MALKADATARLDYRAGYFARSGPLGSQSGTVNPAVPLLLYKMEPEYPEEARKAKYQGTVALDIEIDSSGRVITLRVTRSAGLGLDEKAMKAVKQWRFRPAMKDGRAVAVQAPVDLSFRLL